MKSVTGLCGEHAPTQYVPRSFFRILSGNAANKNKSSYSLAFHISSTYIQIQVLPLYYIHMQFIDASAIQEKNSQGSPELKMDVCE